MPVDTLHPDYKSHQDDWVLMRDVVKGHKAVQAAGENYLPKLEDQTPEEYKLYRTSATFFNATGRVSDALTGMVFRKDPQITTPPKMKEILDDVTLTGVPFIAFAQMVLKQEMDVNRAGVLVDFPNVQMADGKVVTLAVAEKMGLRVHAGLYCAEDIINWRTTTIGGKTVLSLVVLRECVHKVDESDEFEVESEEQYRVLRLTVAGDTQIYSQELWKVEKGGKDNTLVRTKVSDFTPLNAGKPLDYIPFVFFSSKGNEPAVQDPIHYDLAVVNLSHYRNDADMEHGLHFTGLPTPVVTGVNDKDASFRIGSGVAWVFGSKDAKAFYLEFTGQGLGQLRTAKKDKEEQMAALGARMLAPEKKDAEAADTIGQKRQAETSTLGDLANSTSRGLTRVLEIMRDWSGATGDVSVKLNTDYVAVRMPPAEITALLQAVMTGNLSQESFYEALVRGDIVAGTRDFEAEQVLIAENVVVPPTPADANAE